MLREEIVNGGEFGVVSLRRDSSSTIVRRYLASFGVSALNASSTSFACSSSSSISRRNILSAVDRPEAKLEQMRWRRSVFMKPAAFVRCWSAAVNASAA